MTRPRVAPPKVFSGATRAPRPPAGAAGSLDAWRQSSFLLATELDGVLAGLEVEGRTAEGSSGAGHRNHVLASALGHWSRSWLARLQALHALEWGNYAAAIPLIRAAAEYIAAEVETLDSGAADWLAWLDGGGLGLAPDDHATLFRLNPSRPGGVLAAHPRLSLVYRAATDLALPHLGADLLLTGYESDPGRVAMTFGDRDFHVGLAELALGWLFELGLAQVETLTRHPGTFVVDGAAAAWTDEAAGHLARTGRCRLEYVEREGQAVRLIHDWRREARGAPRRIRL